MEKKRREAEREARVQARAEAAEQKREAWLRQMGKPSSSGSKRPSREERLAQRLARVAEEHPDNTQGDVRTRAFLPVLLEGVCWNSDVYACGSTHDIVLASHSDVLFLRWLQDAPVKVDEFEDLADGHRAKRKRIITRRMVAGIFEHKASTRTDSSLKRCGAIPALVKVRQLSFLAFLKVLSSGMLLIQLLRTGIAHI